MAATIRVGAGGVLQVKYLALILDSRWAFGAHFDGLMSSVEVTANALGRLLSSRSGPGVGVRRLYAGVMRSRLLYGAPIWARDVMANRLSLQLVGRLHRTITIRMARGLYTISGAILAVSPCFPGFPNFRS